MFFFFSWALQVGPCRAVFLFLFFISRKRPYKLGLYPTIACSRKKKKQTASVRQKGLTSCLVQALQLVKITHICSRSKGVLAALCEQIRHEAELQVAPKSRTRDRAGDFLWKARGDYQKKKRGGVAAAGCRRPRRVGKGCVRSPRGEFLV